VADLDHPESLRLAMQGHDLVVHAAGHYPFLSTQPDRTVATAARQTRNVLDAAAESGVSRLIFVSSTGTVIARSDGRASTERDRYASMPGRGAYIDAKWVMEELVRLETRFEVSTLCPGACLGAGDMRLGTAGMLVALARRHPVPYVDGWINPVDALDVGGAVVRVSRAAVPVPRMLLAGSNWRMSALLAHVASRYDVHAPSPLPLDEAVDLAERAELESERTGERPALAREFVDLLANAGPVDCSLARGHGISFRPLDDTLHTFDVWARAQRIIPAVAATTQDQAS